MINEDNELARLLYGETNAIQIDIVNRLSSGRPLTSVALRELRRRLVHLTERIDERIKLSEADAPPR